jgi:hypothetical protein
MSVFTFDGRLYEVTESSPIDEDGYHYECWDLSPGSGGELGKIIVPELENAREAGTLVRLEMPVPVAVLLRWMYFVPELRHFGVDPDAGRDVSLSVGGAGLWPLPLTSQCYAPGCLVL